MQRVVLLLLGVACTVFGQGVAVTKGIGSGTAVVALRSHDVLLAAVDSEENYLEYRDDGTSSLDHRTVCKVAKTGPFFAIVAGISHATDGFSALAEAQQAWLPGDDLDALTRKLGEAIPRKLVPLLASLYAADPAGFVRRYRGQAAVQLMLLGAEEGVPQIRVIDFVESGNSSSVAVSVRERGCPRDCSQAHAAWFLGTHDRIDEFVRLHMAAIGHPDEQSIDKLIGLEYDDRPDIVGGPVSIVRVNRTGSVFLREGACSLGETAAP